MRHGAARSMRDAHSAAADRILKGLSHHFSIKPTMAKVFELCTQLDALYHAYKALNHDKLAAQVSHLRLSKGCPSELNQIH